MMAVQETDVVVVGAGPAGLFAVFQCGMVRLACHLVDTQAQAGGQLITLYPEKPIYDIPGFPAIRAGELVARLVDQAAPFHPVTHWGVTVAGLESLPDGGWACRLSDGTEIHARAVILASGGGAFGPKRPPLDGLDAFEGTSVFYSVADPETLRGKRVVIAGGGDSAVDWAIMLADIAARVSVIHRRPRFRAAPVAEATLKRLAAEGAVEMVVPYQLAGLVGEAGRLAAVEVATLDGETRRIEADVLLPFFGFLGDAGPVAGWGLAMDGAQVVVDPASGATSRPGIFACGDICTYPGKLKLILAGFAEAARAAHSAHAHARPGEALHVEHSTTAGVPGG